MVLGLVFHPWPNGVRVPTVPPTTEKLTRMGDDTRQKAKRQDQLRAELPPFLRDMLTAPPRAGEGVHSWLFRVARQLHAHLPAGEIVNLLLNRVQGCGRQVSRKEIEDAVKNSIAAAWQPKSHTGSVQSAAKWPAINKEQREREPGGQRSH